LGENINVIWINREAMLEASKHRDIIKHMFMSQHQTTGQSHYTEVTKKALGKVAKLKYLGKMSTYPKCIHEEIKSRISLGNACYQAVQNLLSCLLSVNIKIKIYKTIILNVLFFRTGC
jgi:acetoacetate decarboxylase